MRFRRRTPKATLGERLSGPAGFATEVIFTNPPESSATVVSWFLDCPGQSPAWSHYRLNIVHLRDRSGLRPAVIHVPGATHEVTLFALDPERNPNPTDPKSWLMLSPINVCEQVQLPDDVAAMALSRDCARAVVLGDLPAEPALSGAVEPWHTSLIRTSAHLRGEEHGIIFHYDPDPAGTGRPVLAVPTSSPAGSWVRRHVCRAGPATVVTACLALFLLTGPFLAIGAGVVLLSVVAYLEWDRR